ncbi:MAG: hypothetical protein P1V35_04150, partial [Planctomycetota bacterium]|nr:hypothetical protein [Planctomycetota bacterium]
RTYTWCMTTPMVVDIEMCEVIEVRNGRIQSSQLYYDSKPHQADIEKDEASSAWVKDARGE